MTALRASLGPEPSWTEIAGESTPSPAQRFRFAGGLLAANEPSPAAIGASAPLSCTDPGPGRRFYSMQRILILLLLFLIVLLQLRYWGGEGIDKIRELEASIAAQAEENERLRARNAALEAEVVNLKEGHDAIEERARAELGLIAKDEVFYRVIDDDRSEAESGSERRR